MGEQYTDFLERTIERQDTKLAAVNKVIENLERTIAGKRQMLDDMQFYSGMAPDVTAQFLELNVAELEHILSDLKQLSA